MHLFWHANYNMYLRRGFHWSSNELDYLQRFHITGCYQLCNDSLSKHALSLLVHIPFQTDGDIHRAVKYIKYLMMGSAITFKESVVIATLCDTEGIPTDGLACVAVSLYGLWNLSCRKNPSALTFAITSTVRFPHFCYFVSHVPETQYLNYVIACVCWVFTSVLAEGACADIDLQA